MDFTISRKQVASIQRLHGKDIIGDTESFVGEIVLPDGETYSHQASSTS